ncbi:MAG: hypothetical protein JXB47_12260 [Anaerolineae bacterium]|nr:hypothetical protein [Anaerolineae bacterium]
MAFEFAQIASLGLGAVIAVIVLNWKRDDDRKYAEALKTLGAEGDRRLDLMLDAFRANTEALNGLREILEEDRHTEQMLADLERRLVGCWEGNRE